MDPRVDQTMAQVDSMASDNGDGMGSRKESLAGCYRISTLGVCLVETYRQQAPKYWALSSGRVMICTPFTRADREQEKAGTGMQALGR
jgi:hypothetical protein